MKRIDELRELSDDHHTSLVLARSLRRASAPGARPSVAERWAQLREAFAGHLEPHFRIEEAHLLPALEAIGEPGLADRIRADHAALRGLVATARAGGEELERFGRLLERHVRFEEREVFEATQHRLPAPALRAIAAACRSTPRFCAAPAGG